MLCGRCGASKEPASLQRIGCPDHSSCEALMCHKNVENAEIKLSVAIRIERMCIDSEN